MYCFLLACCRLRRTRCLTTLRKEFQLSFFSDGSALSIAQRKSRCVFWFVCVLTENSYPGMGSGQACCHDGHIFRSETSNRLGRSQSYIRDSCIFYFFFRWHTLSIYQIRWFKPLRDTGSLKVRMSAIESMAQLFEQRIRYYNRSCPNTSSAEHRQQTWQRWRLQ